MNRMIKLNVHYSKVAGQATAQLLAVKAMEVNNLLHGRFIRYETSNFETTYEPLSDGKYAQLIFLGNEGIPFSHLVNIDLIEAYRKGIGDTFDILYRSNGMDEGERYGN